MSIRGRNVAFVLVGGGSLGALQVGMLRALYEREIVPQMIVGTSAGAINGAFIASRPPVPATADALASRPHRGASIQNRLVADIELHRHQTKLVVLPPPCLSRSCRWTLPTPMS